jgi:hypothetical protein
LIDGGWLGSGLTGSGAWGFSLNDVSLIVSYSMMSVCSGLHPLMVTGRGSGSTGKRERQLVYHRKGDMVSPFDECALEISRNAEIRIACPRRPAAGKFSGAESALVQAKAEEITFERSSLPSN